MSEMTEGAEGAERRVSPGGGQIAERWTTQGTGRWTQGRWQLVGGASDGELVPDEEVEGWTELVVKTAAEDLVTEEVFDLVGPVVGTAMALLRVREDLDTLEELVEALALAGWSAEMVERISEDLRDMLGVLRRTADKVEAKLPVAAAAEPEPVSTEVQG